MSSKTARVSKRTIAAVLSVTVGLFGATANAQSCKAVVDTMRAQSDCCCKAFRTSITSGQANKLDTYAGRTDYSPKGPLLFNVSGTMTSNTGWAWAKGQMQFSDRINPTVGSGQNFSVVPSAVESIDLTISPDGSSATIRNNTWGYSITINQLSCSDGLMYGFGTPVGNTNGGKPAMWIIAYHFEGQVC